MAQRTDPLERMRVLNPVRPDDVAGAASSATAVALLRRITTETSPGPALGRAPAARRRRRLVPALAAASLCFGAVAYALVNRQVSRPETVNCYAAVDLESATAVVVPGARGAAAACAELWARGEFGPPAALALAECVLNTGAVGVFPVEPGRDPCRELNLAALTPPPPQPPPTGLPSTTQPPDPNARFGVFQEAVVERFLGSGCVSPEQGRAIVREELDRAGLAGWTVRDAAPFSAGRPCATLGFDPPAQQVLLIPSTGR